ncbi:MAG: hypothetical protein R3F20_03025 [Planctomycetota bacterium]
MTDLRSLALAALLALVLPTAHAQAPRLGEGAHRYEWTEGWGRLPDGGELGNTHGAIIFTRDGRGIFNTDTERAFCVVGADGAIARSWGADFRGNVHGMFLAEEGGFEFLYFTHTGRHEVAKATPDGLVLWILGCPMESGLYRSPEEFRPTSVAVAPNGHLFVADGYGKSVVHEFGADRRWIRVLGTAGAAPGQFRTPHGLGLDLRGPEPRLVVADRENHRLQTFGLDGALVSVTEGMLRRPCSVAFHGDDLVVADLAGRVTILDRENRLVTQLGDNPDSEQRAQNGVPREDWRPGVFVSPHGAAWDARGDLYVMDWLRQGRVTRLRRLP